MKSLYVHIPFCNHICAYCDFAKVFYNEKWVDEYLEALSFEIKDKNLNDNYDTIYIGGGTPSSLSLEQLKKLLDILKSFSLRTQEYTIEVNPESMDSEKLDLCIKYGINRLSIGVQTFHDHLLKDIQRYHTSLQAIELIKEARNKGIQDINIDLIYGLPHQTLEDIDEDIKLINQLDISHVSIYSLILEDHTSLKKDGYIPLDDEQDALWYDHINKSLKEYGFQHYEVSNYYKVKPSLHNLTYWNYHDYDGVGLSAHSLVQHHRFENTRSLTKYLKHQYLDQDIQLEKEDELFEKMMMGLRLTAGIDLDEIKQLFEMDIEVKYKDVIDKYIKLNMLIIEKRYLKTTPLGLNYLNNILVDFID
ncbi:MAG: radical SAM family heme chaperone HemW [Coprobacillus sp.]